MEIRQSAVSATTKKMLSLGHGTDRLQWLELTTACELNGQSRVNNAIIIHLLQLGICIYHNIEYVTDSFQRTSSHGNLKVMPRENRESQHTWYFSYYSGGEEPSHTIALHYPKSIQCLGISDPVHRTILQPGTTTRSLLPDRNPLRKVSFT